MLQSKRGTLGTGLTLLSAWFSIGCADTNVFNSVPDAAIDAAAVPRDASSFPDWSPPDDGFVLGKPVVYVHGPDKLFEVDPETLKIKLTATFRCPGVADKMTDIAVDKTGKVIGISNKTVYQVDAETGECTAVATVDRKLVGLSFVPSGDIEGGEMLMGIDKSAGEVYSIELETQTLERVGSFGRGMLASGDVVAIKDLGTFATVLAPEQATGKNKNKDFLARINPQTGRATLIGNTGVEKIWGLGFWKKKLYGFTDSGEFVLIDPKTGSAEHVSKREGQRWWGAGVTTIAPVID